MNIASIMREAQLTFGKNGPAQDILVALQDSGRGRRPTLALTGLMDSVNRCKDYIGEVSTEFGKTVATARELQLNMVQEAASTRETENLLNRERRNKQGELQSNRQELYNRLDVMHRQRVKEVEQAEQAVKEANEDWERDLLAFTVETDQGCDNATFPSSSGPNSIESNSVIEQPQLEVSRRQRKMDQTLYGLILLTRGARHLQTKMTKISCRLEQLDHDHAAADDTSKALNDAIDLLSQVESGFCRIKSTYDAFAGYIDKGIARGSAKRLASALEDTSEHATNGQSHGSQAQARTMIDTVLEMRGQFMVVQDMAKMSLDIFHEHVVPCIQKTGCLELWNTILKTMDDSEPS
ncbi:hypothetical protein CSOJ01_03884 [Colletotrichum sojae]|uniref:Uncharacterized protein n=1 Tax=Colletotrichum sojae TaxID=2175907 RepID=A0A8H6JL84_9PEZI|nr:hypothetical protein CSOJ01_03884 [Colletotrichum sojae]